MRSGVTAVDRWLKMAWEPCCLAQKGTEGHRILTESKVVLPPSCFSAWEEKSGCRKIKIQLCPSPRSSKGQIISCPEAARGRQTLKRCLLRDQATGDRLVLRPGFLVHRQGLRSKGPICSPAFSALESKPERIWPGSTKPGSVSIKFPNILRNSDFRPALSAASALSQTPSQALQASAHHWLRL